MDGVFSRLFCCAFFVCLRGSRDGTHVSMEGGSLSGWENGDGGGAEAEASGGASLAEYVEC